MTLRVLRIGTSNDLAGNLPEDLRAWHIASRMLAESSGEGVETTLKRAWPNHAFPGLVGQWMETLNPDVVVLQVNNFWYGHESVPLWFERKFGRAGAKVASASLKAGKHPFIADNRFVVSLNRALVRSLPSATHFTVKQVAEAMETAIRRVLTQEGVTLVVRGNDHWAKLPMSTRRSNNRNIARNDAMSAAMQAICDRHRVPYIQRPTISEAEIRGVLGAARWHNNAEGERISGELDGAAMVAAWQTARV